MTVHQEKKSSIMNRLQVWADLQENQPAGPQKNLQTLVRVFLITAREFHKNELALRASSLTFAVLFSLVPVLAMSTALVKGVGGNNHLRQVVYNYIDTLEQNTAVSTSTQAATKPVPEASDIHDTTTTLTTHLRSAADNLFDYVDKTDFTALGSIGVLIMLITIIMVFDTIEKAMNTIWQVQAGRSPLRKVTDYLTLLILMPIVINVGFAAITVFRNPALQAKIKSILPIIHMESIFLLLLPILSITLALTLCYIIFPNTRVRAIPAFTGGLLAGSLWFSAQNVYITLQIGVSNYNAIYGSFATLPLFLAWLYLGWIFILAGAQFAYACQNRHGCQLISTTPTAIQQLSAAFDIVNQVFLFFNRPQTLTTKMLPKLCPQYPPSLLSSTIKQLLAADIIHTESKNQHLFPTSPAKELVHEQIIATIFGTETPDTQGGWQCQHILKAIYQSPYLLQQNKEFPFLKK
jgi:membrane protein